MTTVPRKSWNKYIVNLRKINEKAADEALRYMNSHSLRTSREINAFIGYCHALATKYGEASGALACEMYEALAELSGKTVPPAVPASTARYGDIAMAVYGTRGQAPEVTAGAIGRHVKLVGVDTIQQNALRDGAEWAWIPSGDTCAFCLTLASRGWQKASKNAIKNGHAEHVHANCDCIYAIRFDKSIDVEGYNPEEYREMYDNADGRSPNEKINSLRRMFYAQNKSIVGAESNIAEEFVPRVRTPKTNILRFLKEERDVEYNPVARLRKPLSKSEIISKVGGGDETNGSCTSVALAYAANRNGLDVRDYRGGASQLLFSRGSNIEQLADVANGVKITEGNDFKTARLLMERMQEGKEYCMSVGDHTAIVRRKNDGFEYLELQTRNDNGFKPLTPEELKNRFGCKKSHGSGRNKFKKAGHLIDIDELNNNEEFGDLLGYINTAESAEVKGDAGGAK